MKRRLFHFLSGIIVPALFLFLSGKDKLQAQEISTVNVYDPVKVSIPYPGKVVPYDSSGEVYFTSLWDSENQEICKSIYVFDGDKTVPFHTSDYFHEGICILNDRVYSRWGCCLMGIDIASGTPVDTMQPYLSHQINGISTLGDSLLIVTEHEFNRVFVINPYRRTEQMIDMDAFLMQSIWYDKWNDRIVTCDRGYRLITLELDRDTILRRIGPAIYVDYPYVGLTTDYWGNILVTLNDSSGVYRLDEEDNKFIKICDVPENPGQLFYHNKEDYLLASNPGDSSFYKISFNREIPDALDESEHNKLQPTLFPNPASGELTVRFELDQAESGMIDIYTMDGRLVYSQREYDWHAGSNLVVVQIGELKAGQYLVEIRGKEGIKSHQRVIIR